MRKLIIEKITLANGSYKYVIKKKLLFLCCYYCYYGRWTYFKKDRNYFTLEKAYLIVDDLIAEHKREKVIKTETIKTINL